MENDFWKTKDLYLAAFIYSQQVELAKVGREDRTCWFYFRNKLRCEELQTLYWSNKGNTAPKIFADAARSLKDLIFAT